MPSNKYSVAIFNWGGCVGLKQTLCLIAEERGFLFEESAATFQQRLGEQTVPPLDNGRLRFVLYVVASRKE